MTSSIKAFWETIDRVNGTYLDALMGLHTLREKMAQVQEHMTASSGLPQQHLDSRDFLYVRGNPNDPSSVVQHQVTLGQLNHRNRKNGENALFLGSMSVVAIYQLWEDRFRNEIAGELTISREQLRHDLLGDLRLIRNAIVHHGGVAKKEIEKCAVLKWFKEGDEILIDEDKMHELVVQLRSLCSTWIDQLQSYPPNA